MLKHWIRDVGGQMGIPYVPLDAKKIGRNSLNVVKRNDILYFLPMGLL